MGMQWNYPGLIEQEAVNHSGSRESRVGKMPPPWCRSCDLKCFKQKSKKKSFNRPKYLVHTTWGKIHHIHYVQATTYLQAVSHPRTEKSPSYFSTCLGKLSYKINIWKTAFSDVTKGTLTLYTFFVNNCFSPSPLRSPLCSCMQRAKQSWSPRRTFKPCITSVCYKHRVKCFAFNGDRWTTW